MRVLVFGKTGQVGRALGTCSDIISLGREAADLTDPPASADAVLQYRPDAVINAAAMTDVNRAESERNLAHLVNAKAPGAMARASSKLGIPFLHISTDYVFDGLLRGGYRPTDRPAPLNVYGQSKLAGEQAVREAGGVYSILRTSWVFSDSPACFVAKIIKASAQQRAVPVVTDQVGGPTPAPAIADCLLRMAAVLRDAPQKTGTYHFCGSPALSRAGFAAEILRHSGRHEMIRPVTSSAMPGTVRRPKNSRLDCSDLEREFGIPQPDWREAMFTLLGNKVVA